MKKGNVLLGLLGGVAVGATLEFLFAPAKGSDTRKKIADKGSDFKDSLSKLSEKISKSVDGFKDEAEDLIVEAEQKIKEEKANFDNLKDINKSIL